jgi:SAM-dependent methyltransferase
MTMRHATAQPANATAPLVAPERLTFERLPPKRGDVWYSMRRYYVDEFFTRRVAALPGGARVADIGGRKSTKRGQFDIEREVEARGLRVTYINLDPAAEPDILADACDIPAASGSFDATILAETVEHLPDPGAALHEAARLLRAGGVLLATAPFIYQIHPDPLDVGRYAPDWWRRSLEAAGFSRIEIEPQGAYFSVLADMLRAWACHAEGAGAWPPGLRDQALPLLRWARDRAHALDSTHGADPFFASFTTGFGVCAVKEEAA